MKTETTETETPDNTGEAKRDERINYDGGLFMQGDRPLGHLINFNGRVFEPNLGQVDVDPALVGDHNDTLDACLVKGLDSCKVGECGFFYLATDESPVVVTTFTGTPVSDDVDVEDGEITFRRNGMTFTGEMEDEAQSFTFARVK